MPPNQLLPNTVWNEKEKVWFWNGRTEPQESGSEGANGGEADAGEFFFDKHERVRFRVEGEEWKDQAPGEAQMARKMEMGAVAAAKGKQRADGVGAGMGAVEREKVKEGRCPWRITVSRPCIRLDGAVLIWVGVTGKHVSIWTWVHGVVVMGTACIVYGVRNQSLSFMSSKSFHHISSDTQILYYVRKTMRLSCAKVFTHVHSCFGGH